MNRRSFIKRLGLGMASLALPPVLNAKDRKRPNALFICVDDMNDWVACLGGRSDINTKHRPTCKAGSLVYECTLSGAFVQSLPHSYNDRTSSRHNRYLQ